MPQMPLLPTTILSPSSSRLAMQASMPEWPLPVVSSVYLLSVWNR